MKNWPTADMRPNWTTLLSTCGCCCPRKTAPDQGKPRPVRRRGRAGGGGGCGAMQQTARPIPCPREANLGDEAERALALARGHEGGREEDDGPQVGVVHHLPPPPRGVSAGHRRGAARAQISNGGRGGWLLGPQNIWACTWWVEVLYLEKSASWFGLTKPSMVRERKASASPISCPPRPAKIQLPVRCGAAAKRSHKTWRKGSFLTRCKRHLGLGALLDLGGLLEESEHDDADSHLLVPRSGRGLQSMDIAARRGGGRVRTITTRKYAAGG
jgi:hypothetical protein